MALPACSASSSASWQCMHTSTGCPYQNTAHTSVLSLILTSILGLDLEVAVLKLASLATASSPSESAAPLPAVSLDCAAVAACEDTRSAVGRRFCTRVIKD